MLKIFRQMSNIFQNAVNEIIFYYNWYINISRVKISQQKNKFKFWSIEDYHDYLLLDMASLYTKKKKKNVTNAINASDNEFFATGDISSLMLIEMYTKMWKWVVI